MPDLIAKPALGLPQVTHAGTTLSEDALTQITAIAPYPGQNLQILGLDFPKPNSFVENDQARLAWTGRDQAFLFGAEAPKGLAAAVIDQSDAWVSFTLFGPLSKQTLARLVALDLGAATRGASLRSALNHMPLILLVEAENRFRLLTFRSMARTAWHEVQQALVNQAARLALTP